MTRHDVAMIAGIAFRNLARHRVKTIITTIAVAVSVALYIFADGWILGMNIDSRRNIAMYEMGAVKIQTPAYFARKDDLPMYESFSGWEPVVAALEEAGYRSAPRFVFSGTLHSRTGTAPIVFNAIDVARDRALLRYGDFIDGGTFPEPGTRGIAIGAFAAEKLHVGIPYRPDTDEFQNEILSVARNAEEKDFIQSLYAPYGEVVTEEVAFSPNEKSFADNRMALKTDVSDEDIGRLWKILSASGRMDVRISTTIDIKDLPERINAEKFERDIKPLFTNEEIAVLESVYISDPVLGDYILAESGNPASDFVLERLLDADYQGAIRHVNQLIDAVVVGVVNSPNPKTNGNIAYIPIDSLQDETGLLLDGHVTDILVRSASARDSDLPGKSESAEAVSAALAKSDVAARFSSNELAVRSWVDYSADFIAAAAGDNISTRVMIFFLFLLSFLGIANTMLMAILERTKEIGMMRALGMADSQLVLAYMIEAALVGLIGSAIGVLIGCLINIPMVNVGIDYSGMAAALEGNYGYRISTYFRSAWNVSGIIGTFATATIISGLMALPPTLRALRMAVTDTLRFE